MGRYLKPAEMQKEVRKSDYMRIYYDAQTEADELIKTEMTAHDWVRFAMRIANRVKNCARSRSSV